jgi:hypothetical protein
MELIGSLFLIAGLALVIALFIAQPFLRRRARGQPDPAADQSIEHRRSALMAERDRVLAALQELDFDNTLGKVPEEEYREQRLELLKTGAGALRGLDEIGSAAPAASATASVEERIEVAVAARRADLQRKPALSPSTADGSPAAAPAGETAQGNGNGKNRDALEDVIAARKRQRKESAAGFCPGCGRPVQKSDKFCSRCGAVL